MKIKCYKVKFKLKIKYFNKKNLLKIHQWQSFKILVQINLIIKDNINQNLLIMIN